jgi:hypothetical protein
MKFGLSLIIGRVVTTSFMLISVNALGIELNVASMDAAWEKRAEMCPQVLEVGKTKSQLPEDFGLLWRISRFAYYGDYALAKGVRASLSAAPLMRDAATEAIKIGPSYHFGGPYRVRGRLYFALPSLISFGDNKLAYEDLKKAKEHGPTSKLNSIYFAEVQARVENKAAALKTIEAAKNIPDAVGVKEDAAYRRDIIRLEEKWK